MCGPVGSGKSTLLLSLLGEFECVQVTRPPLGLVMEVMRVIGVMRVVPRISLSLSSS